MEQPPDQEWVKGSIWWLGISGHYITYPAYTYPGKRLYLYETVSGSVSSRGRLYRAYEVRPGTRQVTRMRDFKTRASARRCVLRWYNAYIRNLERQKKLREAGYIPPGLLCGKCEENKRLKDDYLCKKCRYG